MDRGTYITASAGLLNLRKLEVVSNNLANINTPGFKKQVLTGEVQSFDQTLARVVAAGDPYAKGDHERTPGVTNLSSATDFSPGPIKDTGNPFDVALRGAKDFLVIQTPDGEQYTRAGNFTLNESGELVTMDGMQVLGDGGPITIEGTNVSISPDGSVRAQNQQVGSLRVVQFEDTTGLVRAGGSRFKLKPGAAGPADAQAQVIPNSLEMSNVSGLSSVIDLISAQRAFQAYSKSAESVDQLNQAAINQIGRSRG